MLYSIFIWLCHVLVYKNTGNSSLSGHWYSSVFHIQFHIETAILYQALNFKWKHGLSKELLALYLTYNLTIIYWIIVNIKIRKIKFEVLYWSRVIFLCLGGKCKFLMMGYMSFLTLQCYFLILCYFVI